MKLFNLYHVEGGSRVENKISTHTTQEAAIKKMNKEIKKSLTTIQYIEELTQPNPEQRIFAYGLFGKYYIIREE